MSHSAGSAFAGGDVPDGRLLMQEVTTAFGNPPQPSISLDSEQGPYASSNLMSLASACLQGNSKTMIGAASILQDLPVIAIRFCLPYYLALALSERDDRDIVVSAVLSALEHGGDALYESMNDQQRRALCRCLRYLDQQEQEEFRDRIVDALGFASDDVQAPEDSAFNRVIARYCG